MSNHISSLFQRKNFRSPGPQRKNPAEGIGGANEASGPGGGEPRLWGDPEIAEVASAGGGLSHSPGWPSAMQTFLYLSLSPTCPRLTGGS